MKRLPGYAFSPLFFLLTAMAFWSCRPGNTLTPVAVYDRSGVHALMAPLRTAHQTFTVTAGITTTINGVQGTRLTFYPNSFRNAAGNIVSSGTVQISLLELYRPGDMIANRATTVFNGAPLRSGGQIFITAVQNGQELSANGYGIAFRQGAFSSQPMYLFPGDRQNEDSIVIWRGFQAAGAGPTRMDSTQGGANYYYVFDSVKNFNWINCDYFYSQNPVTDVTATLPDTSFNSGTTNVWLVFPSVNSVTFFNVYTSGTSSFHLNGGYRIPVGMSFHTVAVCNKGGNWYYAELRSQKAVASHHLTLTPTQMALSQILTKLSTL